MTVKVHESCEVPDLSNNNHSTTAVTHSNSNSVTESNSGVPQSLDSVVQRLIDKKMGRRKQNCPQKTGLAPEDGKICDLW